MKNLFLILIVLVPLSLHAFVNYETGNYYMEFRDAPADRLPLVRHYNSLSPIVGWFGKGWGSSFETKLVVLDPLSVAILPYGQGSPKIFSTGALKISDKWPLPKDERFKARLLDRFKSDPSYLIVWLNQNGVKVPSPDAFKVQTATESLSRSGELWKWIGDDGISWIFNTSGHLVKIIGSTEWELLWKNDQPSHIRNMLDVYHLKFDDKNLIQIKSERLKVDYLFRNGELIQSVDASGNQFQFDYNNIGQAVKVKQSGKPFIDVVYSPGSGKVLRVSDSEGSRNYKFDERKLSTGLKVVKVEIQEEANKPISYESHYITLADGSLFRQKLIEKKSNNIKEYEFDHRISSPVKIISDGEKQEIILDSKGNVTELRSMGDVVGNFIRDPKGNQIVEIKEPLETRIFGYDKSGRLNKVVSNLGYEITIEKNDRNQLIKVDFLKSRTKERWIVEPIYKASTINGYQLNGKVVKNIQDKINLLGFLQQTLEAFEAPSLKDSSP